jgi:hypothetical protein
MEELNHVAQFSKLEHQDPCEVHLSSLYLNERRHMLCGKAVCYSLVLISQELPI